MSTEYSHGPFGASTTTGGASTNPFQFTGRENDGTGLYYYRARYYHPARARFLSEDPLDVPGSNAYAYVSNQPTRFIDPLGLWYGDLNVSAGLGVIVTGGLVFNACGIYPYLGGGFGLGAGWIGGSITGSRQDPTPGWNVGVQVQAGAAYQVGKDKDGAIFEEGGLGWPPGVSATNYYMWGPFLGPKSCGGGGSGGGSGAGSSGPAGNPGQGGGAAPDSGGGGLGGRGRIVPGIPGILDGDAEPMGRRKDEP